MDSMWQNGLLERLNKQFGEKEGKTLLARYEKAFSPSYLDESSPDIALTDIAQIEKLSPEQPIDLIFYRTPDNSSLHLRLYQYNAPIPLSDVLPMLENMDLRTFDERPYKIKLDNATVWIGDFTVTYAKPTAFNIESIKDIFQEAFIKVRFGDIENDRFNKLVLGASLAWREIVILRTYAKYLRQTGFSFSQNYIEEALANNPALAKKLVQFFLTKFDPALTKSGLEDFTQTILQDLENVVSLDEDRIIRRLLELMQATLRTNFFQKNDKGQDKDYLAIKLSSRHIPELPLPLPLYEIFVYSPRFEAIHLRNTKVARGGIRWSDRREDFRTEILGLMKAQKVKNAVIVPSGAKGGFVLKAITPHVAREVLYAEVVQCYKSFICGLLDITDNLKDNKVIKPTDVVCYDEDDTYLVVAADKGTSTFSDIANALSKDYGFWLEDAFASGGSTGYDHKKMGITARGAWESVKRHFLELNLNVLTTDFTVVGIGDMSGDVFGNGMLYTPHIKLLAAFDHRNIFLDPAPDPAKSFAERQRLFALPQSSWEDYNPELISAGGGVYKRSSKSIAITPQMKAVLDINADALTPNELIRAILRAPVDLLWNGGIGTYVKAQFETASDVGDKTNEYCRVNGDELRCRVVAEGGNLGFTQLGRVEYSLQGGLINTDFIDNSGGVDCSDHEVNIKILLNQEVDKGRLTEDARNKLLASMTDEVADLVLDDNYNQALAMSLANFNAPQFIGVMQNYIHELETLGVINRAIDFLPDDKKIIERKAAGLGLTRPELAILLAYTKIHIKSEILKSDIPDHPYLAEILKTAFPKSLQKKYAGAMMKHSLRREIIATQLSNHVVNQLGSTFIYNSQIETGASVPEILRAAVVASKVFQTEELQKIIESFNFLLPLQTQYELINYTRRLVYLATRWFLRCCPFTDEEMANIIVKYQKSAKQLEAIVPNLMGGTTKNYLATLTRQFNLVGIPEDVAQRIAGTRAMYTSLNIINVATENNFDLLETARVYFSVGEYFNLLWFRDRIANDTRDGYWESLSRYTLRDELDSLQKTITVAIMRQNRAEKEVPSYLYNWVEKNQRAISRWEKILEMLHSSGNIDYAMFFIALRELSDIMHSSKSLERN